LRVFVKYLAALVFFHTGLFRLMLIALKRQKRFLILAYHKIKPVNDELRHGMATDPSTFQRHLDFLEKHFSIIDESELFKILDRVNPYPKKVPCLITMDDGWQDNYWNAFLKRKDVPFTVFLPSRLVLENDVLWQEKAAAMLRPSSIKKSSLAKIQFAVNALIDSVKSGNCILTPRDISALADTVKDRGVHHDSLLTPIQIVEMVKYKVSFGSHSRNHKILTEKEVDLEEELKTSKQEISRMTGRDVQWLAYPNGNVNAKIAEIAASSGYRCAVTTKDGLSRIEDDPFLLKRKLMHEGVSQSPFGRFSASLLAFYFSKS
jgi:peptidoglycan/xylan/chitin deacetylase (PgdA/CDA1 family)